MTTLNPSTFAQRASLVTLPPEIMGLIAHHLGLSDLKAMRLVKTYNDNEICRYLYEHISLSPLLKDLEKFFDIAAQPHLAKHVQVLRWVAWPTEGYWFQIYFKLSKVKSEDSKPTDNLYSDNSDDDGNMNPLKKYLEYVWIKPDLTDHTTICLLNRHLPDFRKAVDGMPLLNSIQVLPVTEKNAQQLQWFLEAFFYAYDDNGEPWKRCNVADGLWNQHQIILVFLQQIVLARNVDLDHEQKEVDMAITLHTHCSRYSNPMSGSLRHCKSPKFPTISLGTLRTSAFEGLAHVTLLLNPFAQSRIAALVRILQNVHALEGLFLRNLSARNQDAETLWDKVMPKTTLWPKLKYFGLANINLSPNSLAGFVAAHCATICVLDLHSSITARHLIALCGIRGLQLQTLRIRQPEATTYAELPHNKTVKWLNDGSFATQSLCNLGLVPDAITHNWPDIPIDMYSLYCVMGSVHYLRVSPIPVSYCFGPKSREYKWKWGRTTPDTAVHYWQTTDGTGEPTLIWKFTSQREDGRYHFGHAHPRKKTAWYEDDNTYQACPTPYSHKFGVFVQGETDMLGDAYEDGKLVMPDEAVRLDYDEWREVRLSNICP